MTGNAFGRPRYGRPKTEQERLQTHMALYGNTNLPPRGTGLRRVGGYANTSNKSFSLSLPSAIVGAIAGYTIYPAMKGKSSSTQLIIGLAVGYIAYALIHGESLKNIVKQSNER